MKAKEDLPKCDEVWELVLPHGAVLKARIVAVRHARVQNLFRWCLKIDSDAFDWKSTGRLEVFGMPPAFMKADKQGFQRGERDARDDGIHDGRDGWRPAARRSSPQRLEQLNGLRSVG